MPRDQPGPKPRGRRKKIRTEPIRPICPQCEKQFSNQSALTKHKLTHSDERKFACPQCSKAFKRHDHLTGHMQTHSNRKPFTCNIQGCDKTYCDARSLRRHKENIHHIVTPRDNNNNQHEHQHVVQQQQQHQHQPSTPPHQTHQTQLPTHQSHQLQPTQQQQNEPSHLLRRRIQRLHSDQSGTYSCNVDQLACFTVPPHSLGPPPPLTTQSTNGNSNLNHHQHPHQQHHHHNNQYLNSHNHHHVQHASFSADYASTQHFNFDFAHVNTAHHGSHNHLNHHNHHHHHHHQGDEGGHLSHLSTPLEHTISTGSVPHSADSVTDSGLGLNMHYEEHTPQPLGPPSRYNHPLSHQHHSHQQQQQAQPHHVSYSAGYATTQHFDFDLNSNNITTSNNVAHQQQVPASAQHTPSLQSAGTFDFAPMDTSSNQQSQLHQPLEQTLSTGSIVPPPHSADSVTDSGLSLNVHYEQHTPQPLEPLHYHQQHQVSYSAGYATTQHFDFDFNNNTLQARGVES